MKSMNLDGFKRMVSRYIKAGFSALLIVLLFTAYSFGSRYMEKLNRGVVAVRVNTNSVYIGWRMFGTDPAGISFNVYRGGVKVNATPITTSTNYTDAITTNSTYYIKPVIGGVEQAQSETAGVWGQNYLTIPVQQPPMQTMPDGTTCTSTINDCSVGDVDGDGEYEIIMKWDPTNSKDNSQAGYTGDVYLDAYKLNGTRLWRLDLGKNIRAGAHYTQFQVFDYDSDGKAEVVCKTAPGTMDGTGNYLSMGPAATDDDAADYRNTSGYILSGPEYLTVFNGLTGKEMATVNFNPPRGTVSAWGDNYGNRVDRFLACTAYLDGVHPSIIMGRGYYTRTCVCAWDWNGTSLTQRWFWDSNTAGAPYAAHVNGLGNHNLSVGDANGDGKDEIIYGPIAIDSTGHAMYDTMLGHGDAMHLGKLDPDRPGLQVWDIHETYPQVNGGGELHDAATGAIIWGVPNTGDTGRGMAADIDANYRGYEMWSPMTGGVYNANGTLISTTTPSMNFRIYWDGDLQDELLDGTKLDKWTGNGTTRLFTFYNYRSSQEINGTKANPCLQADILGDWREEVIYRNSNNQEINIFTTTTSTTYRFYTLMHDIMYRLAVAWQNTAYNQPPHVSFYLGDGPSAQPTGDIIYPATTPANSPTQANTFTRTVTATFSRTPSQTGTFTATRTVTVTFSATLSTTPTLSFTATRTATLTITATPTATKSFTASPTQTSYVFSPTPFTPSATLTASSSDTATRTFTHTATATSTPTSTPTYTATQSATLTQTVFNSQTSTPTVTQTNQMTATWTAPPTDSATATATVTPTTIPAGYTELQIENACSYDGGFENIHTGYTGTGYANLDNTTGSSVMFFIDAMAAQTITLDYRFANGTAVNRDMSVEVNSVVIGSTLAFPPTGTWETWADSTVQVNLIPGRNEITVVSLTANGGPNMDRVSYISPDAVLAPCVVPETPTQIETDTPQETPTQIPVITDTYTATCTSTVPSATYTQTVTATASYTPTDIILSPTNTPTNTPGIPSNTRTFTVTMTRTATVTPSVTRTSTPTATSSAVPPTATPTCTATNTPVAAGKFVINQVVTYPNPYTAIQPLSISFNISHDSPEVYFRLYTSSFRLIRRIPVGQYQAGVKTCRIPASSLKSLSNGTYYYYIEGTDTAGKKARSTTAVLIILKSQ